jgi:lauroyl/myristoyl acyltransferase
MVELLERSRLEISPIEPPPQQPATLYPTLPRTKQKWAKQKWTSRRIYEALRRRLEGHIFHHSYAEGMRRLAAWSGNPMIQNLLYRREVSLFCRFCNEIQGSTSIDPQELQRNLMGNILLPRVLPFVSKRMVAGNIMDAALQEMQSSPSPLLRELSQLLVTPDSEQGRQMIDVQGREFLEDSFKAGRGVIILLYHATTRFFGVHKLLGPAISQYTLGDVGYRNIFHSLYGSAPLEIYQKSMPQLRAVATKNALQMLSQGGIVTLAGDSWSRQRPSLVNICGRVYPLQNGFAELALATNAALLPTYTVLQLDGQIQQHILPALDTGNSHWSHEERVAHIMRQVGAFLTHTWRAAPGTLEWIRFETHFQSPQG